MGKRIIQQRRGRGTHTYKVKKRAFIIKIGYPRDISGEGTVLKLKHSPAHSAPLAKIQYKNKEGKKPVFFIPAFKGMAEGDKINLDVENTEIKDGNIMKLKNIDMKTKIYCIESRPGDGGKFIKSGGSSAEINKTIGKDVFVVMPSKKQKKFSGEAKAIVGVAAGHGRLDKPIVKAGKNYHIKKAKSKLWPRTSACKMNAIDHPFGSGRGKVAKPRIAKRNSSPGQKVGLIRPKRTGKRK